MMIMKGCGGNLRVAAGGDLAPDPRGAADLKTRQWAGGGYITTTEGAPL